MEPNQNTQPNAPITSEPGSGHKMAYMIVGLFALIVIAAVAVPFTLNVFKKGNQAAVDKKEVTEDLKTLNSFREGSTLEAQQNYLKSVDARLQDNNVSDDARDLLLMRKAIVLAVPRGDAATIKRNADEAVRIFSDLLNRPETKTNSYMRDFSLVAVTRLELQCCNVTAELMPLTPVFKEGFDKYTAAGYNPSIAGLLAMDVATAKISQTRQGDAMNRLNSMDIAAKLLSGYYDQLQQGTRDELVKELGDHMKAYPSLKPLTFTDATNVTFEANNKLAIANDWYTSLSEGGKSAAANKDIDRQYEDVTASLKAAISNAKDKHGLNEVLFYNQLYYLESIDRRYGSAVDEAKKNEAINTLLGILKNEEAIAMVGKLYFPGAQKWKTENPEEYKKLTAFTHFMDLAKENADIAAYMKSIGVTI